MSTVGEQLRQAREAQNITVYQVAEATKIRTDHIRALDEGNYDMFSAPVYIRGFVRSYAAFIKLDVPPLIEMLNQELALTEKHHGHPPLMERRRGVIDFLMFQLSKLNWRIVLPLLAVSVILLTSLWIYRLWRSHQSKNPLSHLGPGLYQPGTNKTAGELLPLPSHR